MATPGIEREGKFITPPGFDVHLILWDEVGAVLQDKGSLAINAVYWDTENCVLLHEGWAVRYRSGEGWTVKHGGHRDGAYVERSEEVFPGEPHAMPQAVKLLLTDVVGDSELEPVVRLKTLRRVYHLMDSPGHLAAELVVDKVQVESGLRQCGGFNEVEVEVKDVDANAFCERITDYLQDQYHFKIEPRSKYAHALELRDASARAIAKRSQVHETALAESRKSQ